MTEINKIIEALGGKENIEKVDACSTKLRVIVKDESKVFNNSYWEENLEAKGVIRASSGVQVIYGKKAEEYRKEIEEKLDDELSDKIIEALGGKGNIEKVDACSTKLRVIVKDESKVFNNSYWEENLEAKGVIRASSGVQVIYGKKAEEYRKEIEEKIK
ncbi:PTS transporter subunit EIIB [Oceanivirga miroungae]|uniref:PTS system alpha-glucoside-specific transporter subunit IIBC n=1 Tax=Oceanivirga miroungae TaxID=1130046 RepID=A0A6I8MF81_9FUSO|nr:PTS glucose/sucrose transporter subunit IIB [Oceanivirga miroungae]VWL85945.1 PTS system alpha-glucoside-specific transporter subunit IIBC [Oceanivirga miroungae]